MPGTVDGARTVPSGTGIVGAVGRVREGPAAARPGRPTHQQKQYK
ncbi:hypothetical protein [Streptomyces sp. NPDC047141]